MVCDITKCTREHQLIYNLQELHQVSVTSAVNHNPIEAAKESLKLHFYRVYKVFTEEFQLHVNCVRYLAHQTRHSSFCELLYTYTQDKPVQFLA